MAKNYDKHLELLKRRGWLTSADSMKNYETKITNLTNSLQREILEDDVRPLFSKDDIQAIEQAIAALTSFKNTVADAKEHQLREEARKMMLREQLEMEAIAAVEQYFSYDTVDHINKLSFILAVADISDVGDYNRALNDINWRTSMESVESLKTLPIWIENFYRDSQSRLSRIIVGHVDVALDRHRVHHFFTEVMKSIPAIREKEAKRLNELAWLIAKHDSTGLTDTDKKSLGL